MAIDWSKYGLNDDQIGEIQAKFDEDVAGLKAKNDQLLSKNKTLQEQRDEHTRAALAINSELDELRAKLDNQGDSQGGKPDNASAAQIKRLEKEREALAGERDALIGKLRDATLNSQLDDGLSAVNVPSVRRAYVKAYLRQNVQWDGDSPSLDGASVKDYIQSWAATDEGKAFVAAPENSGSGSQGAGHRSNGKAVKSRAELKRTPGAVGQYIMEHGREAYERLPTGE